MGTVAVRGVRASRVLTASAVAAYLTLTSGAALAAPSPETGPTAGGTAIAEPLPAGITFGEPAAAGATAWVSGSDGSLYSWGAGFGGTLGNGTDDPAQVAPSRVLLPAGVPAARVAGWVDHALALGSDGVVYAWGNGNGGAVGPGGSPSTDVPAVVPLSITPVDVAVSSEASWVLAADGTLYGFGTGYLGDGVLSGAPTPDPVPVTMPAGVTFTAVDGGEVQAVALGSDGNAYTWGRGQGGTVGNGSTVDAAVPTLVQMPAGVTFTQVSAGSNIAAAVGSDGNVYTWGVNFLGTLGTGTVGGVATTPVMVQNPGGVVFTAVRAGNNHMVALAADGTAYAWGSGTEGQLGTGDGTSSAAPVLVAAPAGVRFTSVAAGDGFSMGFGSDGKLYTWGFDGQGQLGNGATAGTVLAPTAIDQPPILDQVTVGGAPGVSPTSDGTQWSAVTPPHACGPVDVTTTFVQYGTTSTVTTPNGFTYGSAPVVTSEPVGTELPAGGGPVTLAADATGDDAPTVRWQRATPGQGDWADVPGATSPQVTIATTAAADYRAVFANCLGAAVTARAAVTLADAPSVGAGPAVPPTTGGPAVAGHGPLAATGTDVAPLLALALAAVGVGAVMARTAARRRRTG